MSGRSSVTRGRGGGRGGGRVTQPQQPQGRSDLPRLLQEAMALGFDPKLKRSDGKTYSNLDGAAKYEVLKTFLKNERRKIRKQGASSSETFQPETSKFTWMFLGSQIEPDYIALPSSSSEVVYQFPDFLSADDMYISIMHLLFKANPTLEMQDPLASITAVDKPGDNLVLLAFNSRFVTRKLEVMDDAIGYRITFTEPVKYNDIREKIRFIVSTMNLSPKPWLYVQPWGYVRQNINIPPWDENGGSYVNYTYAVDK